jgi:phosphoribosyl-AMP cyclohydrolase
VTLTAFRGCAAGAFFPERWPFAAPSSRDAFFRIAGCEERAGFAGGGFCPKHVVILQQTNRRPPVQRKERSIAASPDPRPGEGAPEPFVPRFDAAGLITAVAVDASSGALLMLAHMDAEALARTRATGLAHFHSRSRGRLWMKGESSGHVLRVVEIRVDCDQDALALRVEPAGPACHTGAASCFYRRLDGSMLVAIDQ